MKTTIILTAAALVAFASPSFAGPGKNKVYKHGHHGSLTKFERILIAKSRTRLFRIKQWARADGHVNRFERMRIRRAQIQHNRLVARAWRS